MISCNVTGTVNLGAGVTTLSGTLINGFTPEAGQQFTIIQSTGGITGTFAQGSSINIGGTDFTITYNANSVVLSVPAPTPTPTPAQSPTPTPTATATSYSHGNVYAHSNSYLYADWRRDSHVYTDTYSDCYAYANGNGNTYGYGNSDTGLEVHPPEATTQSPAKAPDD